MNAPTLNFNMNDATTLAFVQSQITHVETEVYKTKYPSIQYPSLIPVDTKAHPWAATVTFYAMDAVGEAKFVSGNGDDIPYVNLNKSQFQSSIYMAGIGYQYNIEEVNQAMMLGLNLPAEDATTARRISEEFTDNALLRGNSAKGFNGLINYPGITTVAAPNGAAASPLWANKTADEILSDINNLVMGIWTDTLQVETADTLLLSLSASLQISNKRIDGTAVTLREYIMANNAYTQETGKPLTIRAVRGLETAGAGSTERAVAYRRSPEVLKGHIPMPHRFLPMQTVNLQYKVPGIFRLGGLDIRLPGAVRYLDGI